jgi:glycine/D-amino acid oxidase-like deaminating enzyme/nitrite reductase/ring-hydroxylating ferredoxin subunit
VVPPPSALPGRNESCWTDGVPDPSFSKLQGTAAADVAIVGGGIVGLTAAMALRQAGKSVIVLESRRIGRQVTGRSTAKVTTQHGLVYRRLIDESGRETAQLYAEANRHALAQIRTWIETLRIACDYERKSAFAYAVDGGWQDAIAAEAEAARSLGFDARLHEKAPLPFPTAAAIEFTDQAQFNPVRYLLGLAQAVQALGGQVFEQSRATKIGPDAADTTTWRAESRSGAITARHILVATNMTVKSPVGYSTKTQPRCHTAIAFRTSSDHAVDGMFIGVDEPTHSIRTGRDSHGPLLVVLGPKFNTGQDGDVARRFVELDRWAHRHLPVGEAVWRWCNEDYDTADHMPFVGMPDPEKSTGFHVATGFNAWGISNGTAAGLMVAETIVKGAHRWRTLFDPTRPAPEDFHQSGDTQSRVDKFESIPLGGAGVVGDGEEKIAAWRDEAGKLHCFSASCTHKGCTVTWNNADRTWDCPCHGSVFSADGDVIHGPAKQPLKRVRA